LKCPTCNSKGFKVSILGPDRCTFCDGTEGGNPPEKPLHVRVAEALGCEPIRKEGHLLCGCYYKPPASNGGHYGQAVDLAPRSDGLPTWGFLIPRYDTDWAATGPLIEKLWIMLDPGAPWCARDIEGHFNMKADTPLIAVCNLILKMKEKGTL
jgi:hypothetical protein